MRVAVYGRSFHNQIPDFSKELIAKLASKGIECVLHKPFYDFLKQQSVLPGDMDTFTTHRDIHDQVDFFFSLGGDGTLLGTLALVRDSGIPIVGINLGRLGFLSSIATTELDSLLDNLLQGDFVVERKTLIELSANKPLFGDLNYAMNEFTIQRKDTSSMITIRAFINGELLTAYWADGIIVATPTGSTAYSLSCGGPIIYPECENFVITPVAPHNLNVRPIVVSSDVVISFEVQGRERSILCTLDSRHESIDASYLIAVKKAPFTANLVRLNDASFLTAIREKLMWGQDQRN